MDNAHMIYVYTYPRWQVLSAEMDCALQDERQPQCKQGPPQMGLMVELKTSRQIENDRMRFSFQRYKMLSWWIQSFLAGVPRITVGWRDDDGIANLSLLPWNPHTSIACALLLPIWFCSI